MLSENFFLTIAVAVKRDLREAIVFACDNICLADCFDCKLGVICVPAQRRKQLLSFFGGDGERFRRRWSLSDFCDGLNALCRRKKCRQQQKRDCDKKKPSSFHF